MRSEKAPSPPAAFPPPARQPSAIIQHSVMRPLIPASAPRLLMKNITLITLAFLVLGQIRFAHAAIKSADSRQEDHRTSKPVVIKSYREILTQVPAELRQMKAT